MTQPVITSACEAVVSGGFQLLVLATADQIDGFGQMLGDVKLVEDDLAVGLRKVLAGGVDIRVPHVHGSSANGCSLIQRKALPESVQTFFGAVFRYKQHSAPIQIIQPGEVVARFGKRLVSDTETVSL